MAIDHADIVRRLEPILYFHKDERFFPSDAKRYLERCALWNSGSPRDDNRVWGNSGPASTRLPLVERGKIVGLPSEPREPASIFLGEQGVAGFPFLFMSDPGGGFLDLTGWLDNDGVSPRSENRFADLDRIEELYEGPPSGGGDDKLRASRYWYHAEVFEFDRLKSLMTEVIREPMTGIFLQLKDPLLVCYYLFFPGHVEPLAGCGSDPFVSNFGSYAGEWACVAVLCEGDGSHQNHIPTHIGLTGRNVPRAWISRVGMCVYDWVDAHVNENDRGTGKAAGLHPLIYVAKGTHSLYLRGGPHKANIEPWVLDSCGQSDIVQVVVPPETNSFEDLDKVFKAAGLAGLLGPLGTLVGLVWTMLEDPFSLPDLEPPRQSPPEQGDEVPNSSDEFSRVIHPEGVIPPGTKPSNIRIAWPNVPDTRLLNTTIDGRTYSLLVRRNRRQDPARPDPNDPDPDLRQVWWPGEDTLPGYKGHWGPLVTIDPWGRRAGMEFPEFWAIFMLAFARFKSGDKCTL